MSTVRPLAATDLPALAQLFVKTFRPGLDAASPAFLSYLGQHYLTGPVASADLPSLVHADDAGRLTGFVGVNSLAMRLGERRLRAAICGALMVDDPKGDPLAGARLLKAFLAGPQDVSLSETANDVSTALWTRLGGLVLPDYSMDWLRILRPLSFAVDRAGGRVPALRLLAPVVGRLDRLVERRSGHGGLRWSSLGGQTVRGVVVEAIDQPAFAAAFATLAGTSRLAPDLDPTALAHMVAEAASIRRHGLWQMVAVRTAPAGTTIGVAGYYLTPGRLASVLQIVAAKGRYGTVFDALLSHLHAAGAVAAMGRTQPVLIDAILNRRVALLPFVTTVVHSRDPDILAAVTAGEAFINGFVGEKWSRLVEDDFE